MKTYSVKPSDIKKNWVLVDAADQTLGRLATQIATVLRGKHKPSFVPHLDCGDNVVVLNAAKVKLTGNKWRDKFYYRHSGYIGGIKQTSAADLRDRNPDRLISNAVKGMLPKNKLSRQLLTNLRVYPGAEHPHEPQQPLPMPVRLKEV